MVNVLFVCKHQSGDNDDEGAVTYALTKLGHEVTCVHEMRKHRRYADSVGREIDQRWQDYSFCLFFKWPTVSEIAEVAKRIPCAFWHFDMIRSVTDDPSLKARSESRVRWMCDVLSYVIAGFCTDGDWVERAQPPDRPNKLVHLMQGADERYTGFGRVDPVKDIVSAPILFTGMKHHGRDRANHIDHLQETWGDRFQVMGDGGPRRRKHGRELADVFASTKIVVAPNGPSTDRYWSNRVYLTLGFGGFLIHPYCEGLLEHYTPDQLVMYHSVKECDELIDFYLRHDDSRLAMQLKGYARTMLDHRYRNRCEELIRIVKERI